MTTEELLAEIDKLRREAKVLTEQDRKFRYLHRGVLGTIIDQKNKYQDEVRELTKEVRSLRESRTQLERKNEQIREEYTEVKSQVEGFELHIAELNEAVLIYGVGYCGGCSDIEVDGRAECTCGFRKVYIKAIADKNARTEDHSNTPSEPRGL